MGISLSIFKQIGAACQPQGFTFIPTWYKYLDNTEVVGGRCTPIIDVENNPEVVAQIVLAVIEMLMTVGGLIAIGFVIYGGIKYIISQGEPDKIKDAQHTIQNSLIGLVITILAASIVSFVARSL